MTFLSQSVPRNSRERRFSFAVSTSLSTEAYADSFSQPELQSMWYVGNMKLAELFSCSIIYACL